MNKKWETGTALMEETTQWLRSKGIEVKENLLHVRSDRVPFVVVLKTDDILNYHDRLNMGAAVQEIAKKHGYVASEIASNGSSAEEGENITIKFRVNMDVKISIEKRCKKETTWKNIATAIHEGRASDLLEVGDRIPFTTKHGIEAAVVVAHIKDNKEVYFVLDDAWEQKKMVDKISDGKLLSWAECNIRRHLQEKVFDDLPDDMAAVINKRTIKQHIGTDVKITEDKLWLLSHTEVFGRDDRAAADDESEFHFDLFCDERSRVKQRNGETDWWWLRTPNASSSTHFRYVGNTGYAGSIPATTTFSVCFGFCIK